MNQHIPVPNQTIDRSDDEISFKEIVSKLKGWFYYFLHKWKIILIAGIAGGVIGLMYGYSQKPVYTSELSFALEEDQGGLGGALSLASQFGFDLGGTGGGAFAGDNLFELMKSRSLIEKVLLTPVKIKGQTQTLAEHYISFNKLRESWATRPDLRHVRFLASDDRNKFSRQQDSILGSFYNSLVTGNLKVDRKDKKVSIVNVTLESEDELFAKYFIETLVSAVSNFYAETKTKRSAMNLNALQHQTDSVRRELNAAISGTAVFVDANPNPNPARQVLRVPSQRRQVDIQANTAILSELVKHLEIAKVTLRKETPFIQIIDSPILPLKKKQLSKKVSLILGGFLGGFVSVLALVSIKLFKEDQI